MCRLAWLALAALALAACTPTYNWREMPVADGALRVAFPGKPDTQTRELPLGEHPMTFQLTAAEAGGAVYAVGHGRMPAGMAPDQRAALREALEQSLSANLQAARTERRTAVVRHAAGAARPGLTVDEIEIQGEAGEQAVWLLAQVFVLGDRLVEVAAIGPQAKLSRETARTFLDSLRLQ
ncbi:hypothetical protein GCM10025795_11300 [Verticiella sediminum]